MKTKILIVSLCGLIAALTSQAAWTVVSTFDDSSALSLITDVTNLEGSNARSEIVDGKWAVFPGELFASTSNVYAMLDMGVDLKAASIATGQPVTVYVEVVQPTVPDGLGGTRKAIVDVVWGVSNHAPAEILEHRYNGYNVMQRIEPGADVFEGRNGGAYESVDQFMADVTYRIWMVVDYNLNYYETYIQGGQWTQQTRLGTLATEGYWEFRVNPGPDDVVQYFQVSLSRGTATAEKGIDPTYFDNIAYDATGINLTVPDVGDNGCDPGPGIFAGYCVVDGWVDTGAYMGLVYVAHYPWAYVLSLKDYIYVGWGAEGGAWMFLPR